MLITIDKLKALYSDKDFSKYTNERLEMKLGAIETFIRNYTHNAFINRNTITKCDAVNGALYGYFQYYNEGDTIMLYNSGVNDGMYHITKKIDDTHIEVNNTLYSYENMRMAKIEYPLDIIDGCVELLDYDLSYRAQANKGIASETISRHSVSYVQSNANNTSNGYPIHLLGFLKKYINWRT